MSPRTRLHVLAGTVVHGPNPEEACIKLDRRPAEHLSPFMFLRMKADIGATVSVSVSITPPEPVKRPPSFRDMRGAPSKPGPA